MSDSDKKSSQSSELTADSHPSKEILPGYATIEDFTKDGFKTLMEAIRHSNALPNTRDYNFYKTFDAFSNIISDEGSNILRLMNRILRYHEIDSSIRNRVLDDKTELVVEANDVILEKVANNIDELLGIKKNNQEPIIMQTVSAQLPINGSWNRIQNAKFTVSDSNSTNSDKSASSNCIKLITAKNIVRPQKFFKDKIDNSNLYPWEPRIKEKPNSLKPLAIFLEEYEERQEFSHPYEYELERFTPLPENLQIKTPIFPKPLTETPLIEVNNEEQLDALLQELRNCSEFAVDVEHHSYRTFMGITCLLQISTLTTDYLVDTLALRDKLHILNEVFTKNSIVKIFHGADKDVEWLQRDLSLYIVNMFDTHQAAKVLEYPALSLAYLLKKFCDVNPDKQFQLADWRIRPLPDELKKYAREDTHYLIYIYNILKSELFAKANKSDHLLKIVFDRSTEICKKRYFKPILNDDSHLDIYRRSKKMFDNRQLYALREIYAWRDQKAREEDESLAYVLPNHMLLQIAESLPREMQGILACCNPIPPLVRSNLLDLHNIILKAREQPIEKAILKDDTTGRGVLKKISKVNVDSALHCPHDLTKINEFRDDLPTLISDKTQFNINLPISIEKTKSSYSVFDTPENSDDELTTKRETFKKIREMSFLSPYERYKLVKPFVQAEEEKIAAQKHEEEEAAAAAALNVENDNRTDAERIASIREHFLTMSRKFSEELEAKAQKQREEETEKERQKSLLEKGGSKKRKREASSSDEDYDKNDKQIKADTLITPLPALNFNNRGVKRKFNNDEVFKKDTSSNEGASSKTKNSKQRYKQRQKKKRQQEQQFNESTQQQNQNMRNINKGRQNKQERQKQDMRHQNKNNSREGNQHVQQNQHQSRRNKNKGKEDNSFVPYDYASVDFRQFQGGAGSAPTGTQLKNSGFKAKGRKKFGNKGAKSETFASTNNGRGKGRGRGR